VDIATPLRQARVDKEWAQYEVSERLGVALRTFSRWESGERKPDIDEFIRWCRVLEVDPAELVGELVDQLATQEVAHNH
jgi:transcriptional regulator with XRE-family HTH domain